MRPAVSHPGTARSGTAHDDGPSVHLRPLPRWSGDVLLAMASSILPPVVHDEAAERRTRTRGLLRRLRVQAAISQEHRRVASEAMADSCITKTHGLSTERRTVRREAENVERRSSIVASDASPKARRARADARGQAPKKCRT
jgi:hypothetical protein